MYDFDKLIPREETACVKYDLREAYFQNANVLPMWVADMDFETPVFIREAVIRRAHHPIYGYSFRTDEYYRSIMDWLKQRWKWEIEKDWLLFSPGIVPGVNFAVQSLSEPGDGVMVQPPVYFPFFDAVSSNGRKLIQNPLTENQGRYGIDYDNLEACARESTMLLLSSPHNPVGRCWTREELSRLGEICRKHEVIIISDEIHGDLIMPGYRHVPLASIAPEIADITVTCIAPSKTFNLAGMATSSVIISNEELRKKFKRLIDELHISGGNIFGTVASVAAYEHGAAWLDQLMQYVKGNYEYLKAVLESDFQTIVAVELEATYLLWLDFRKTGLNDNVIKDTLIGKCGLGLSHGPIFGQGGEGYQRINLAAPRSLVEEAVKRLKKGFH
jgi:cystathionine beta-lyase